MEGRLPVRSAGGEGSQDAGKPAAAFQAGLRADQNIPQRPRARLGSSPIPQRQACAAGALVPSDLGDFGCRHLCVPKFLGSVIFFTPYSLLELVFARICFLKAFATVTRLSLPASELKEKLVDLDLQHLTQTMSCWTGLFAVEDQWSSYNLVKSVGTVTKLVQN